MKNILALAAILFAVNTSAQITLSQSSYPSSVTGTDSLKKTTYASVFPSLSPADGGLWDMSVITDTTPIFFAYRVSPIVPFDFADSGKYSFSTFSYFANKESQITSSAISHNSMNIFPISYSLTSITTGATDSLFVIGQNALYSSLHTIIAFPATYHSYWSSSYQYDFNFQISIAIASYNHAPGIVRTYTFEKDSVVGRGQMRVKNMAGIPSGYQEVLQVQTTIITTDSFFINGTPALASLLTSLGLIQGQKDTVYQQNYYRTGEVTPLAQVTFKDATFTQPKKATTHVQRLPPSDVLDPLQEQAISIYPNPVTGTSFTLSLPSIAGQWDYTIINATGQLFARGPLKNTPTQKITLPTDFASGLYFLKASCNGRQAFSKPFSIPR